MEELWELIRHKRLKVQTCVLLTIVAPRFTNAIFRFTIKPAGILIKQKRRENYERL